MIKLTSALNTLFRLERNFFHWDKGWNESRRQCTKSVYKVRKKVHKKFSYNTDTYVCDNFCFFLCVLLFHFFGIWLTVKYKDFLIIQILHVFILLHKNKWKVQHVCCVLCCTFYRKFLVTIFNLGYKWYFVKTSFIISQLTISDWSEDVKSATCEPCL